MPDDSRTEMMRFGSDARGRNAVCRRALRAGLFAAICTLIQIEAQHDCHAETALEIEQRALEQREQITRGHISLVAHRMKVKGDARTETTTERELYFDGDRLRCDSSTRSGSDIAKSRVSCFGCDPSAHVAWVSGSWVSGSAAKRDKPQLIIKPSVEQLTSVPWYEKKYNEPTLIITPSGVEVSKYSDFIPPPAELGMIPSDHGMARHFPMDAYLTRADRESPAVETTELDGVACFRISYTTFNDTKVDEWISADRGYSVIGMDERFHNRAAGEFHDSLRSTVELHEPSGIWFPVSLDYHRTINGILSMREQVDISVHSLNTELDPGVFSLGGIKQLSPGTRVLKYRAEGGVERDRMEWDGRQIVKSGVRSESENPKVGPVSNPGTTSAASPSPFEESPPAESSSPGASSPQAAETVLHSTGIEFVRVPAGGFVMGDLRDGVRIKDKVKPHEVQISRPFEMSRHEITVGQFRLLVEATNRITDSEAAAGSVRGFDRKQSSFIDNGSFNWRSPGYEQSDRHPVVYVSRDDAMEFCKWLTTTDSDGRTYRLPTEAEWEYACRAGTKTRFSCGDDPKGQAGFANVADQALTRVWPESPFELKLHDKHPFTAPVGSFKPNPFGLCDMHGNVWEWCSDKYSRRYYARSPVQDPTGPKVGRTYAARGGSWVSFIADSSFRNSWKGNVGRADFGFRVVREL